jgi:hypothetical protein
LFWRSRDFSGLTGIVGGCFSEDAAAGTDDDRRE